MTHIKDGDLEISVTECGTTTLVVWSGEADLPAVELKLRPFVEGLRKNVKDRHVIMDFRKLSYANSKTITELVFSVRFAAASAKRVDVHYDEKFRIQRSVFSMLERLQTAESCVRFVRD